MQENATRWFEKFSTNLTWRWCYNELMRLASKIWKVVSFCRIPKSKFIDINGKLGYGDGLLDMLN